MQLLLYFVQACTHQVRQGAQRILIVSEQRLDRQGHQHAIERAIATSLVKQIQQRCPATGVDVDFRLGQIASGRIDQHAVFGEVPIAILSSP